MDRWMGYGTLPAGILTVFHPFTGAAYTACWLWTGLMLEDAPAPYTRKQGPLREGARAFFLWCIYAFAYAMLYRIGNVLGFISMPLHIPYALFIPLWSYLFVRRIPLHKLSPLHCLLGALILLTYMLLL